MYDYDDDNDHYGAESRTIVKGVTQRGTNSIAGYDVNDVRKYDHSL